MSVCTVQVERATLPGTLTSRRHPQPPPRPAGDGDGDGDGAIIKTAASASWGDDSDSEAHTLWMVRTDGQPRCNSFAALYTCLESCLDSRVPSTQLYISARNLGAEKRTGDAVPG